MLSGYIAASAAGALLSSRLSRPGAPLIAGGVALMLALYPMGRLPVWLIPFFGSEASFAEVHATATGSYAASGTASGEWMASIVTLKTS